MPLNHLVLSVDTWLRLDISELVVRFSPEQIDALMKGIGELAQAIAKERAQKREAGEAKGE